jgi:hypothetical protein
MLTIVNLILGASLLLTGRKLFWLFVAAMGFMAGAQLTASAWGGSELTSLIVGLAAGLLFAALALFFKSLAIGVAGFLGGGTLLLNLAGGVGLDSGVMAWVVFIVGGAVGILLLTKLFDWALIFLSSVGGSLLIARSLALDPVPGAIGFFVLSAVGVAIQVRVLREEKKND